MRNTTLKLQTITCLVPVLGAMASVAMGDPAPGIASQQNATYNVQDLGAVPHIADDTVAPINAKGDAALWVWSAKNIHAALWQGDRVIDLGTQSGYPNSIAHAINGHGEVAGWMNTSNNPVDSLSTTRGFIYAHKHFKLVGTLGGRDSRILGLNDSGNAVGDAELTQGQRHAVITKGSGLTDLGTLPDGTFSQAFAISNSGIVVGVADVDGKFKHAVEWQAGKISDLGTLVGGTDSCARAVNDNGQIAGYSETPNGYHAFFYSSGKMQDLGTLGSDPSMASGIDTKGDVVGTSALAGYGHHAFLWQSGALTDLNTRIPRQSGWILTAALSINDSGQIVCTGFQKGESPHLILLSP